MRLRIQLRRIYEHHLLRIVSLQRGVDLKVNTNTISLLIVFFVFCGVCSIVAFTASFLGVMSSDEGANFVGATRQLTDDSATYQLLNFSSWEAFTSHCCCLPFSGLSPVWPHFVVEGEKWICNARNDQTADFLRRRESQVGGNGSPLMHPTVEEWLSGGLPDTLTNTITTKERYRALYTSPAPLPSGDLNSSNVSSRVNSAYDGFAIRPLCGIAFTNNCTLTVNASDRRVIIGGCDANSVDPASLLLF